MADETIPFESPGIHVEWFDFADRSRGRITPEEISSHVAAGRFVWIDVDLRQTSSETLRQQIGGQCGEGVDLGDFAAAHAAAPRRCHSQLLRNNDLIHMRIVNASIDATKGGRESPPADVLDVVVGNSFLATIRTGASTILTAVRRDYSHDFAQHASTPSFLIYEIWSRQVEAFLATENRLEDAVEDLRHLLNESADDVGLTRVSFGALRATSFRGPDELMDTFTAIAAGRASCPAEAMFLATATPTSAEITFPRTRFRGWEKRGFHLVRLGSDAR